MSVIWRLFCLLLYFSLWFLWLHSTMSRCLFLVPLTCCLMFYLFSLVCFNLELINYYNNLSCLHEEKEVPYIFVNALMIFKSWFSFIKFKSGQFNIFNTNVTITLVYLLPKELRFQRILRNWLSSNCKGRQNGNIFPQNIVV